MSGLARAQAQFDGALLSIASAEGPASRWLRERSALIHRLHAEMLAEQAEARLNESNSSEEMQ